MQHVAWFYKMWGLCNRLIHGKEIKNCARYSVQMSLICTKCKTEIPADGELDEGAAKYPCCSKCWAEWKEYRIMVMNEMHLDMSMPDHRKVLKKHEKIFVGVMSPEGDIIDYSNEDNLNPDA